MKATARIEGCTEECTIVEVKTFGVRVKLDNPYFGTKGLVEFANVRDEYLYKTVAIESYLQAQRKALRA